ncbi:MAG: type III-A CRISPR-associated RAMP protein Csm5 [Actinobacteria bacterium]|nr:type III-A CRISPR-associated RAMP protein Csm5 [Actinomycetota bacterium]
METRVLELEIITPVHVGSHEGKFSSYDYAISGGNLYVIHQGKLADFLATRGKVEEFTRVVERQGNRFDIGDFLDRLRVTEEELESISRYRIAADERAGIRELQPHIRDASGRDYLPGSSIKGAMRTACTYVFLKVMREERPEDFREVVKAIENNIKPGSRERGRQSKNLFDNLNKQFLQKFNLPGFLDRKNNQPRHGPNTDVLRCLRVTDAYPVQSEVAAVNARVLDKGPDQKLEEESPLYIEAVTSGTYRFEVTWDEWLADRLLEENRRRVDAGRLLYPRGISDVLEACRAFVEDQIAWEEDFFKGCINADGLRRSVADLRGRANFRLGWGSGLVGASISMLLPEELKDKIRNRFFPKYDKRVRDFPKSRRVAYQGRVPLALMGFCRLREVVPR